MQSSESVIPEGHDAYITLIPSGPTSSKVCNDMHNRKDVFCVHIRRSLHTSRKSTHCTHSVCEQVAL